MKGGKRTLSISDRIYSVNRNHPSRLVIKKAAALIRRGELVAFPTETVYGLGANGLNSAAVRKIFKVKGRPLDNPLILHVGYKKDVERYATEIPASARMLIRTFWPGPLTVILKKKKTIPDTVTAGLETVALRMPDNKIALSLIRAADVPIAAPSANISGKPSPTSALHVQSDLRGKVSLILDGGETMVGIESTIIDCSVHPPAILRPGKITQKEIERVVGKVEVYPYNNREVLLRPKSPGLKYRHYAPDAPLVLVEGEPRRIYSAIRTLIRQYRNQHKRIGILAFYPDHKYHVRKHELLIHIGCSPQTVSRKLYATLRYFDDQRVDVILAESFPKPEHAIVNRLRKAASEIISA